MAKASKSAGKKSTAKRSTVAPRGDKRFVRRDERGRFTESDDAGRSLSRDRKQTAKKKVKSGYGDKGDQAPRKSGAPKKSAGKKTGRSK